ncbi:MAG: phenylalanine--tRNA ligase subunit beta, partial [Spirochaetia bacterium]|nr:phenylalanine--tRNA ligase subunit beta [Spirochaetia bacterium]
AACFDPKTIRQTSKRHKISTDSSVRFEKGISIDRVEEALAYAVELILEFAGGNLGSSVVDVYSHKPKENLVFFRYAVVKSRLGVEIDSQKINKIFTSLGFQVKYHDQTKAQLLIPNARKDIHEEWDLLEEVARIYGYGELPEAIPSVANGDTRIRAASLAAFYAPALALGYQEALNYSFADNRVLEKVGASSEGLIPLQNPVSPDFARLRGTLLFGLLENVKHNQENLRRTPIRFFETGRVFRKDADRFSEQKKIGFILAGPSGPSNWITPERETDYFDLAGDIESFLRALGLDEIAFEPLPDADFAPGLAAKVLCGSTAIGRAGKINEASLAKLSMDSKAVFFAELDLEELLSMTKVPVVKFVPYSPYPAVARDLAFVMGRGENVRAVQDAIRAHSSLIHSVGLADVYTGDKIASDKKSVVFSIQYQSMEKTFTSAELEALEKSLIQKLTEKFPISLR